VRISANVTADFGIVTDRGCGALRAWQCRSVVGVGGARASFGGRWIGVR